MRGHQGAPGHFAPWPEQFDDDALRVDPLPAAAFIALDDGTETALVRARLALERQDALRYAPRSPQIRKS